MSSGVLVAHHLKYIIYIIRLFYSPVKANREWREKDVTVHSDPGRVRRRLGKDEIVARILIGTPLLWGVLAVGMAFIPPIYNFNTDQGSRIFCPVPALYDRSAFVDSMGSDSDNEYAERVADDCGDKIQHHLRMSIGAMTLTLPTGFLALLLYVRRELSSLSKN